MRTNSGWTVTALEDGQHAGEVGSVGLTVTDTQESKALFPNKFELTVVNTQPLPYLRLILASLPSDSQCRRRRAGQHGYCSEQQPVWIFIQLPIPIPHLLGGG